MKKRFKGEASSLEDIEIKEESNNYQGEVIFQKLPELDSNSNILDDTLKTDANIKRISKTFNQKNLSNLSVKRNVKKNEISKLSEILKNNISNSKKDIINTMSQNIYYNRMKGNLESNLNDYTTISPDRAKYQITLAKSNEIVTPSPSIHSTKRKQHNLSFENLEQKSPKKYKVFIYK